MGGEHAGLEQKGVGARCIRPDSDDVPGGVDPGSRGRGGSREVDGRESAGAADEAMFDPGGVKVVAHDLSGIVDADGLSRSGAGEVYVAEGAATLGEAVRHAGQVSCTPTISPAPLMPVAMLTFEPGTVRIW